jgi:hypothetical protein
MISDGPLAAAEAESNVEIRSSTQGEGREMEASAASRGELGERPSSSSGKKRGAALLARVRPGKNARREEVGEKGAGAGRFTPKSYICVAHHIGVRHACFRIVQNQPQCNLDSNLHIAQWFWFCWLFVTGRC